LSKEDLLNIYIGADKDWLDFLLSIFTDEKYAMGWAVAIPAGLIAVSILKFEKGRG
jgi:hypothetical protein